MSKETDEPPFNLSKLRGRVDCSEYDKQEDYWVIDNLKYNTGDIIKANASMS